MDRLGGSRQEPDDGDRPIQRVGSRMADLIKQAIASVVILATFLVLAYLVLKETIPPAAVILYAGVILGYLLHGIKDLF